MSTGNTSVSRIWWETIGRETIRSGGKSGGKQSGGKLISSGKIIFTVYGGAARVNAQTAYWLHDTCTVHNKYMASIFLCAQNVEKMS